MHTALRSVRRRPALAGVIVLTLALGISLMTVVVSIADRVLFRELPYRDARQLITISTVLVDRPEDRSPLAAAVLTRIAAGMRTMASIGAYRGILQTVTTADGPTPIQGAAVSSGLFEVLGIRMLVGPGFTAGLIAAPPRDEIVLSHALWQSTFSGDRSVIGRPVTVNGRSVTVVGVLPKNTVFPIATAEIFAPLDVTAFLADEQRSRRQRWFSTVARLADGATMEQAQRELSAMGEALSFDMPLYHANERFHARSLREQIVGPSGARVRILLVAGLVLLAVACANAASVLWANAITRRGEFAVRAALGASRGALARQLAGEGLVLGAMGGVLGLTVAPLLASVLRPLTAPFLPAVGLPAIDARVLAIAVAVCVLCGVLLGVLPAMFVARGPVADVLRGARSGVDREDGRVRGLLLVVQTSLCVALLVSAGLLIKSFVRLRTLDIGIQTARTLTFELNVPRSRYTSDEAVNRFYDELERSLGALPGVQSVASTSGIPMAGGTMASVGILGRDVPNGQLPQSAYFSVSDSYFAQLGIAVRRGRLMSATSSEPEVVVNESMARRFWPSGDAIGAQVRLGPVQSDPWARVVGIVADMRDMGPADTIRATAFGSNRQYAFAARGVMLKAHGDPTVYSDDVRRIVKQMDPAIAVLRLRSYDAIKDDNILRERVSAALLTLFAVGALLLALVGVYGLTSAFVAARTREFGIRIALGAQHRNVIEGAMRRGAVLTAVGVAVGLALSATVARLFSSFVHGVSIFDPTVYASVSILLGAAALVATWLPARRAARVDPLTALRSEA